MKLQFETVTDAALVGLFDPSAARPIYPDRDLPDAFGDQVADGSLFVVETGADGAFLLDVYVDVPLPDDLVRSAERLPDGCLLRVPGGRLFGTGLEDLAVKQGQPLPAEPTLGQAHAVPPGSYRLVVYLPGPDDQKLDSALAGQLSPADYRLDGIVNAVMGWGVALALAGVVATCLLPWHVLLLYVAPALAAYWAFALVLYNSRRAREVRARRRDVERQFPSLVVHLTRLPDGADLGGMKGGRIACA